MSNHSKLLIQDKFLMGLSALVVFFKRSGKSLWRDFCRIAQGGGAAWRAELLQHYRRLVRDGASGEADVERAESLRRNEGDTRSP